jgi:hypothetical protein
LAAYGADGRLASAAQAEAPACGYQAAASIRFAAT